MSFISTLAKIKQIIDEDENLQAFVSGNFDRPLSVRITYKERLEINKSELPVIIMTRPEKALNELNGTVGAFQNHTVLMYIGFHCHNQLTGQIMLIQFEELVEAAIMKNQNAEGVNVNFTPGPSRNDQGANHPEYFLVKSLTAEEEIRWTDFIYDEWLYGDGSNILFGDSTQVNT
jgi:hypothetical protein